MWVAWEVMRTVRPVLSSTFEDHSNQLEKWGTLNSEEDFFLLMLYKVYKETAVRITEGRC